MLRYSERFWALGFDFFAYGHTYDGLTYKGVIVSTSGILFAALFCFSMVFALLGVLYVLVRLSTSVIRVIETRLTGNGG